MHGREKSVWFQDHAQGDGAKAGQGVAGPNSSSGRSAGGAGKIIIENLTRLEALVGKAFRLACFPLKIAEGDGSPVRAVAML